MNGRRMAMRISGFFESGRRVRRAHCKPRLSRGKRVRVVRKVIMRVIISLVLLFPVALCGCASSKPRVVLYCAQDQEFAEGVLGEFTRGTGFQVDVKFDTEADK